MEQKINTGGMKLSSKLTGRACQCGYNLGTGYGLALFWLLHNFNALLTDFLRNPLDTLI